MYCRWIKLPDGIMAMICGSRGTVKCRWCRRNSTKLCDFDTVAGTCDAPLCDEHATQVGANTDLCPDHAAPNQPFRLTA